MMSNYGYGGRPNPYDDRGAGQAPYPSGGGGYNPQPYDSRPAYNNNNNNTPPPQQYSRQPQYNAPGNGRDEYDNQNIELKPLVANGQEYGQNTSPSILDQKRVIQNAVDNIVNVQFAELRNAQSVALRDANMQASSQNSPERKSSQIMENCKRLVGELRELKYSPEYTKYKKTIDATSNQLHAAIMQLKKIDMEFEEKFREQIKRQYLIVNPDASDRELKDVANNPDQPVFAQALMQSGRQGQARSALSAVQSRHEAIQKINEDMIQLSQLFQDMENLVVQQEASIVNIEAKGEEVVEHMQNGTEQMGVAVKSAKNARKWKWWCLGICLIIVIIIVIIVLLYQFVFGPNAKDNRDATKQKRWVLPSVEVFTPPFPGSGPCAESHIKIPGLDSVSNKLELVRKAKRFQA